MRNPNLFLKINNKLKGAHLCQFVTFRIWPTSLALFFSIYVRPLFFYCLFNKPPLKKMLIIFICHWILRLCVCLHSSYLSFILSASHTHLLITCCFASGVCRCGSQVKTKQQRPGTSTVTLTYSDHISM